MRKTMRILANRIVCAMMLLGLILGVLPSPAYAAEDEIYTQPDQENIEAAIKYVDHTKRGFDIRGVVNGQEVNLTTGGEGFTLYISGHEGYSKVITDIELNKDYAGICDGNKYKICLTPEIHNNELTINVGLEAIDKYIFPHRFDFFIAAPVNFQGTNHTKLSYDSLGMFGYKRRIKAGDGYCHLYIDSESDTVDSWIGRAGDMEGAIKKLRESSCGDSMPAGADNAFYIHQHSSLWYFSSKDSYNFRYTFDVDDTNHYWTKTNPETEKDTVTVECSNPFCQDSPYTVNINAEDKIYDGTPYDKAVVTDGAGRKVSEVSPPEGISVGAVDFYSKSTGEKISYAPSEVGEYIARSTVTWMRDPVIGAKSSFDIEKEFTISPSVIYVKASDTNIYCFEEPENRGVLYSIDGGTTYVETPPAGVDASGLSYSYDYRKGDNPGEYSITPSGVTSSECSVIHKPGKLIVDPKPTDLEWYDVHGGAYEEMHEGDSFPYDGVEHTIIAKVTEDEEVVVTEYEDGSGTDAGSYQTVAKALSDPRYALPDSPQISWEITKADASIVTDPRAVTGLVYDGSEQELVAAGEASGGKLVYALDSAEGTYNPEVPKAKNAGDYEVYYKVEPDKNHKYDGPAQKLDVSIEKARALICFKDTSVTKPVTTTEPFTNELKNTGDGPVTYASGNPEVATVDPLTGEVTILAEGETVITATVTDTENVTYADKETAFLLTVGAGAMEVTDEGFEGDYDGQAHGITVTVITPESGATVKYGTEEGSYTLAESPTYISAGEYKVFYKVEAENYETVYGDCYVIINKAAPALTPPEAKTDLIYNGSSQELVTGGAAEGGTLLYAMGEDSTSEPEQGWSESFPEEKDCGTYYIWYRVLGDADHKDINPVCAGASVIGAKEITISGITAVDKTYDGTTSAELDLENVVLTGKLDGDDLRVLASGLFEDADVGENKTVNISDLKLLGADAKNYFPAETGQQTETTASIQKRYADITAMNQTVDLRGSIRKGTDMVSFLGAAQGHRLASVTLTSSSTREVTTTGTITPSDAVITSGGVDVTKNYEIVYHTGTLTVREEEPEEYFTVRFYPSAITGDPYTGLSYHKYKQRYETVYKGTAIKPEIEVTGPDGELKEGVDYTVSYSNNLNVTDKAARVTVSGKGNLAGTRTIEFYILRADLEDAKDKGLLKLDDPIPVQSGGTLKPAIFYGKYQLKSTDFVLSQNSGMTEDTTVDITGARNFAGTLKDVNVKVLPKQEVKDKTIKVTLNAGKHTYDGNIQTLGVTELVVTAGSSKESLVLGEDYTVDYVSNTNAGKATAVITARNGYLGTVMKTFTIAPDKTCEIKAKPTDPEKEIYYSPKGARPDLFVLVKRGTQWVSLFEGKDYKITCSNNKKVGQQAKYKITFLGNYKGHPAVEGFYDIAAADISEAVTDAPDMIYKKPGKYYAVPYVSLDKVTLTKKDYIVRYYDEKDRELNPGDKITLPDGVNSRTITIRATGTGNYKGMALVGSYDIVREKIGAVDMSKVKIVAREKSTSGKDVPVGTQEYTGSEIVRLIRVLYKDGNRWRELPEYAYSVTYINNREKGKATILVSGNGISAYGSKTTTFNIRSRSVKTFFAK